MASAMLLRYESCVVLHCLTQRIGVPLIESKSAVLLLFNP
jgi:hypothetical protein